LKKIYVPFPLNFAIVEVDPLYELLAIPIVIFCVWLVYRRTLVSALFLSGVFMIAPAFLIAFNQIAWTPYAERYVYIASAFIVVASVFYLGSFVQEVNSSIVVRLGIPCLLVLLGLATLERSWIWHSNLTLYADTVEKSPTFSNAWNEYAVALAHNGELERAKSALIKAGSLYHFEYDQKSDINIADLLFLQGKEDEAQKLFDKVIKKTKGKSPLVYERILSHLYDKLLKAKDPVEQKKISLELIRYSETLYALNKDPFLLFRMGQIYSSLGERQKALSYYKHAYNEFHEGDKYKVFAQKLIARLEKG
jgi:tetratricopeptide (TPR) repeat protein